MQVRSWHINQYYLYILIDCNLKYTYIQILYHGPKPPQNEKVSKEDTEAGNYLFFLNTDDSQYIKFVRNISDNRLYWLSSDKNKALSHSGYWRDSENNKWKLVLKCVVNNVTKHHVQNIDCYHSVCANQITIIGYEWYNWIWNHQWLPLQLSLKNPCDNSICDSYLICQCTSI